MSTGVNTIRRDPPVTVFAIHVRKLVFATISPGVLDFEFATTFLRVPTASYDNTGMIVTFSISADCEEAGIVGKAKWALSVEKRFDIHSSSHYVRPIRAIILPRLHSK